jgi:hypothetical protein
MTTMTETSIDKRVDVLANRVDRGFERVDEDIRELRGEIQEVRGELHQEVRLLRAEMKSGFEGIDAKCDKKFDSLNRTIIVLLGGSLSVVTGGLIGAAFHLLS